MSNPTGAPSYSEQEKPSSPLLLSVATAAQQLGVSTKYLYDLIAERRLPVINLNEGRVDKKGVRLRPVFRIQTQDLTEFMAHRCTKRGPKPRTEGRGTAK